MFHELDLKQLSEMSGAERAFVSVYLTGEAGLERLERRSDQVRRLLAGEEDELEHFERSLEMIETWLEEHALGLEDGTAEADGNGGAGGKGYCAFASWALDFVWGMPLAVAPPRDRLWIGPGPYVRPLAELQDEYETFAVVAADNRSTRIYLVASAEAELEATVSGGVKNRVKKGGWSQKRYSRRRDNELSHYAKEVALRLAELDREEEFGRIVLLGSGETLREIGEALPEPLAERVVATEPIDLKAGEEALMDHAFGLFFEEERHAEGRHWDRIKNEALAGGLAVTGRAKVLEAATAGRVDKMVVTRDAKIRGRGCRDCEHMVYGTPETCQSCGSSSLFEIDLVDEVVRRVTRTGGEVDFVDEIPALSEVGDMAALLRW